MLSTRRTAQWQRRRAAAAKPVLLKAPPKTFAAGLPQNNPVIADVVARLANEKGVTRLKLWTEGGVQHLYINTALDLGRLYVDAETKELVIAWLPSIQLNDDQRALLRRITDAVAMPMRRKG